MFKVMIVDDDAVIRYDLKRFEEWNDYNFEIISEAENGQEALALIEKQQYDLIFSDIKMPCINGLQLLSALRESNNDIPVVIMSGYSDFTYARQCIRLGAYDYLLKPIDEKELRGLLETAAKHIEGKYRLTKKELPAIPPQLEKQSVLINRICEYIGENADKDITLAAIASHFGYSSKYLGKLFRTCTGEGFVSYITRIKMERAKQLVSSGKYKNYEISDMLGYENPDYFTKLFKKHYGVTLLEYRKAYAVIKES